MPQFRSFPPLPASCSISYFLQLVSPLSRSICPLFIVWKCTPVSPFLNHHHKTPSLILPLPEDEGQVLALVGLESGPGELCSGGPGTSSATPQSPLRKSPWTVCFSRQLPQPVLGARGEGPKSVAQNLPQCLAWNRLLITCSELWENNSTTEYSFFENHTLPLLREGGSCQKALLCSPK